MSQVETVALWAGLIASIAGIVLSIVATVFAIWVSKQAAEVNQQMIRSLQKIESTVEHLSADTRELITAGWNKMLSGIGSSEDEAESSSDESDQISGGIANEVRSQLTEATSGGSTGSDNVDRIEELFRDLKETLAAQLRRPIRSHPRTATDELTATVRELPLEARALLSVISRGRHLTRDEYRVALLRPNLKMSVKALRAAGFLVPLQGLEDGERVPVYYLPPNLVRSLRIAIRLAGDIPRDVINEISSALATTGYQTHKDI